MIQTGMSFISIDPIGWRNKMIFVKKKNSIQIFNIRRIRPTELWDVKVDRSNGVLGNKFYMSDESERCKVCDQYEDWLELAVENNPTVYRAICDLSTLLKRHGRLNLFCWCAPRRCHAESIRKQIRRLG